MGRKIAALTGIILFSTGVPGYAQSGLDPYAHIKPTRTSKPAAPLAADAGENAQQKAEAMPRSLDPEHCGMVVQVLDSALAGGKKIGRGILSGTKKIGTGITGGSRRSAGSDKQPGGAVPEPDSIK